MYDRQTESWWLPATGEASEGSPTCLAVDGRLAGTHLESVVHRDHVWFSWAAFAPGTTIRSPQ